MPPAPPAPGQIALTASWEERENEPPEHLVLDLANVGGQVVSIGPGANEVRGSGPQGAVPIAWTTEHGARALAPGERTELVLHPGLVDGAPGLTLDHANSTPVTLPPGSYRVCIQIACATAVFP